VSTKDAGARNIPAREQEELSRSVLDQKHHIIELPTKLQQHTLLQPLAAELHAFPIRCCDMHSCLRVIMVAIMPPTSPPTAASCTPRNSDAFHCIRLPTTPASDCRSLYNHACQ
jgi:hypothetical protein